MQGTIYQPGESVVHRLNPVTKLVVSISLSVLVFVVPDYRPAVAIAVGLLALILVAGVGRTVLRLAAVVAVPFGFFLLLIQGILNPAHHTTPLVTVGPVTVWEEGFAVARLIFFRVVVLVMTFLLMATTSEPQRMRIALIDKGVPSELAYVFLASLQIIPEIRRRAQSISEAQQARGLDTSANVRTRLRSVVALLAPLLIGTLIVANTRAIALSARGFNRKGPKTFLYDVPDPAGERVLRWASVGVVLVAAGWRVIL